MNAQITEALVRLHEAHQVGWDDDARDAMRWLEDLDREWELKGIESPPAKKINNQVVGEIQGASYSAMSS